MVTGFPTATSEEKIQGIEYYLSRGLPVNAQDSALILAALGTCPKIAKFLFESGARIVDETTGMLCMWTYDVAGNHGSALNEKITTIPECVLLLLEHITTFDYPESFIRSLNVEFCNVTRMVMFTTLSKVPERLVQGLAALIHRCYVNSPSAVVRESLTPKDPSLRAVLLTKYGITYDIPVSQAVYAAFHKNNQECVALTQTCQVILDEVKTILATP